MGTSPPKQNDWASVTLRAKIVAAAASTALPPALRISSPASTAPWPPAATAPFLPLPDHVPGRDGCRFCSGCAGSGWADAAATPRTSEKTRNAGRRNRERNIRRTPENSAGYQDECEEDP